MHYMNIVMCNWFAYIRALFDYEAFYSLNIINNIVQCTLEYSILYCEVHIECNLKFVHNFKRWPTDLIYTIFWVMH